VVASSVMADLFALTEDAEALKSMQYIAQHIQAITVRHIAGLAVTLIACVRLFDNYLCGGRYEAKN